MFINRGGRAWTALALLILVAVATGCASKPLPPQVAAPQGTAVPTKAPEAAPPNESDAASLDGAWEGKMVVASQELGIKLNFQGGAGTIDVPAQSAKGIHIENVAVKGDQVSFQMLPKPSTATFTGTIDGEKMGGAFEQAGYKGTWSAARQAAAAEAPTAAVAKEYKEEEVTFRNGDTTLAGTLSIPNGPGPHPAVVLISGSGAQNRDEEIFGMKPFAILADALTRKGIAVLRYDDRGIGGSTTGSAADTSETYAGDVSAAYDYLRARTEIDSTKIGLLGHSEGGIIAPMVAANRGDVAFVVMLAGSGVAGKEVLLQQVGAIAKANGADQATVDQQVAEEKRVLDAVLTGAGLDQVKADVIKQSKAAVEAMPEEKRKQLGDIDEFVKKTVEAQFAAMQGPWMNFFLTHDPAPVLEKVNAPVLALFGGKDVQVVATANEPAVKTALEKGGNKNFVTKTFDEANHLFQAAQTGSPSEYTKLKPEFAPGVLDTITTWVAEQTK